jgi:2-hydroxy-6-oxonona-2,4-dienedioate hydrolase
MDIQPVSAPPSRIQHHEVNIGPYKIHYRHHEPPGGQAAGRPPIVLVHGFVVSGTYLEPSMQPLAEETSVYAPDLPGHGQSNGADEPLSIPELADVLMDWTRKIGLEQVDLVGNSMGCSIATAAAERHGEHIRRLVLQGPTMEPEGRDHWHSILRALQNIKQILGTGFEIILIKDTIDAGIPHTLGSWRHAIHDRLEDRLPNIHTPTLIIQGDNDPMASVEWAQRITQGLPRARLETIPGADHIMVYNDPERFAGVVLPFLRGKETDLKEPTEPSSLPPGS